MSKNPAKLGLLALAMICGGAPAMAQATVAQVLGIKPKCDDVVYTTPAPADIAKCNVETKIGAGAGYILTDATKRPLRKFVDTDGDGRVDTWSFYKDGEEVYRESVANNVYSFRWIGAGGMKWAVGSVDGALKAKIESWRMISADEAAQEAFQALATGDFDRMKALFITPQEIQALGLPANEGQKLVAQQQNAKANFQKTIGKLPGIAKATFSRLENAKPGSFPADLTGGKIDIVKIPSGLILFENGAGNPKKHDWINSYEMVQVGNTWRLTDVPSPDSGPVINELVAKLSEQLSELDKAMPPPKTGKLGPWTVQRTQILQKIAEASKADERENWYKQILDNLAHAIIDGDETLLPMLAKWKAHFVTTMPGSNMAAYAAYRELWSSFELKLSNAKGLQFAKVQEEYQTEVAKFIQAYPTADDTPDALLRLATGSEFAGKDDEAKKWYEQIAANFPNSTNFQQAAGAIRRLDSVGKNFVLAGPTLSGKNYTLNPGKITVVYYWASYSGQAVGDFATMNKLLQNFGKDLDIVSVNLDEKAKQATDFLKQSPLNVEHLHQPGAGSNGPLATHYGILGLPHLFLLDANGRVVSNKVQVNALEEEIGKLTKK